MNNRYPPDADFEDMFDVSEEQLARVLALHDAGEKDEAFEILTDECGLSYERAEDALEWNGR